MAVKVKKVYEQDFYAWTKHTTELLRQGKFSEVDIEHVAEEIESCPFTLAQALDVDFLPE